MKRFGNPLLSLAAPFLIAVAIFGLVQRNGSERLQCLPALIVGFGLIISGAFERGNRRKRLFLEIRNRNESNNTGS